MYAAPPTIETRVFASLPQGLRIKDRKSAITQFLGENFDSFLEGPSFDTAGNLYCVDIAFGRIFRVDPQGRFDTFVEYDGEPNGLKIHRDGRLFIADRRHGIVTIDPATRQVHYLLNRFDLEPFRGPNDLVFSAQGDLYFTDQGLSDLAHPTGRVYRLRADGRLEIVLDQLPGPNGIALDAAGRVLYVAMTRANSIWRAPLLPDGRTWRVQNFIQLSGGAGPDGIAVDSDGGLTIAHPHLGAVWLFDALGQPRLRVNLCNGLLPTNVAYGGPDGRRLYITELQTGAIHIADMPCRGVSLFSHLQ